MEIEPHKVRESNSIAIMQGLGAVMNKVGIVGFIILSITVYIFAFLSQDKKDQLTDTWLLFKCGECNPLYIILITSLLALLLIQSYFYRKAYQQKDQRIEEISKEKTKLQEILLNKKLKSSK
jgi:H+/Cl- antiporter ClcA